jgi:hypothetical protein
MRCAIIFVTSTSDTDTVVQGLKKYAEVLSSGLNART